MNRLTKACTPTLPPEEVNELCRRYTSGDQEALELLVSSHVAFVASIANRYGALGVPVEDLTSEGVLGLIEAVKRFDPERGNRFLTYAVFWIRRHILDSLRRDSQPVRRPRKSAALADASSAAPKSTVSPRTPTTARTVTMDQARARADTPMHFQSLDHAPGNSGEPALSERLEDTGTECPEEGLLRDDTRRVVWSALDRLRPNQRLVMALRHGLCDDERWTLRQVGSLIGVSRERVRQIEMQAVEQLRRGIRRVSATPVRTGLTRKSAGRCPRRPLGRRRQAWSVRSGASSVSNSVAPAPSKQATGLGRAS